MFPAARFKRAGATDAELTALEAFWGADTDHFAAVDDSCVRDELARFREIPDAATDYETFVDHVDLDGGYEAKTVAELRAIADERAVEIPPRGTKAEIIAALEQVDERERGAEFAEDEDQGEGE